MEKQNWVYLLDIEKTSQCAIIYRQRKNQYKPIPIGEDSCVWASAALDVIQHFGIVMDEPGQ